jgi:hypothetical protein
MKITMTENFNEWMAYIYRELGYKEETIAQYERGIKTTEAGVYGNQPANKRDSGTIKTASRKTDRQSTNRIRRIV